MVTTLQVNLLVKHMIEGIFINPGRYDEQTQSRIPKCPYYIYGALGTDIKCIPIRSELTQAFLNSIHMYGCNDWNKTVESLDDEIILSWRDGESAFLLSDPVLREEMWLSRESKAIRREFLQDLNLKYSENNYENMYRAYPIHQFSDWTKSMKMFWYIAEVGTIEDNIKTMSLEQISIWLQLIGSDVLSSVEKLSPAIEVKRSPFDKKVHTYTIYRSERILEVADYTNLFYNSGKEECTSFIESSDLPHIKKLRGRMNYLKTLN